jgi:predicted HTH domain antitoxin
MTMTATPQAFVKAGLYPNEQSVIQEAMRVLWQERPQLRINWAIYQYQTEDISLAKAASIANVSFDRMKEILMMRGVQPRLGPETIAEACQELKTLEQALAEKR